MLAASFVRHRVTVRVRACVRLQALAGAAILVMAVLALARSASAAGPAAAGAVPWETSLEKARAASLRTNQAILVEFWAVWCPSCEEMDREVYSDERISAAMRKVTAVRVDIDRQPLIARQYGVTSTPTLMLMDGYGNELFRFTGTLARDRVLQLLDETPADITRLNALSAKIAATRGGDFAALVAMGQELRQAAFYRASSDVYTRALKTREGRRPGEPRAGVLLALAQNAATMRAYGDARKAIDELLTRHAGSAAAAEAAKLKASLPPS
jgi:thioredoxin-like negative regulator of GroEL